MLGEQPGWLTASPAAFWGISKLRPASKHTAAPAAALFPTDTPLRAFQYTCRYIHTYQVTWVKDKEPTLTAADLQRSSEWLAEKEKGVEF